MPLIRKPVKMEQEYWDKLIEYSRLPENQRPTESQGGIIIKEFLDKLEADNNEQN